MKLTSHTRIAARKFGPYFVQLFKTRLSTGEKGNLTALISTVTSTTRTTQQNKRSTTMSTYQALVVTPEMTAEVIQISQTDSLSVLQGHVGGYVDAVSDHDNNITFWIHDEGKLIGLEPNMLATLLWWALCPEFIDRDALVGTVVITGGPDRHGANTSVPADLLGAFTVAS